MDFFPERLEHRVNAEVIDTTNGEKESLCLLILEAYM